MAIPWQGIKELCRPCIALLANDEPFNCELAGTSPSWTCSTCWTVDANGKPRSNGNCAFPNSRSIIQAEKDAFRDFALVHGKKARKSPGGHLITAREIKSTQSPAIAQAPSNIEKEIKPEILQLVVKLKIGKAHASKIAGEESVETSRKSSLSSRQPSPRVSGHSTPAISGNEGKATTFQFASSRRPSSQSGQTNHQSLASESSHEGSSETTGTPRKRRRLLQGLKKDRSAQAPTSEEVAEAVLIPAKKTSSFQTNADLMARFQDTLGRRGSEDQSQSSRLGTSTPFPEPEESQSLKMDDSERQPEDSVMQGDHIKVKKTESLDQTNSTALREARPDLGNLGGNRQSESAIKLFAPDMEPEPPGITQADNQSQDIIVIDTDSESQGRSQSPLKTAPEDSVEQAVNEIAVGMDLDTPSENGGPNIGRLSPSPSIKRPDVRSVEDGEDNGDILPSRDRPSNPALVTQGQFSTMDSARPIFGAILTNQPKGIASIPVSPMDTNPHNSENLLAHALPSLADKMDIDTRITAQKVETVKDEPPRSVQIVPIIASTEQPEDSPKFENYVDANQRKRASMADDYVTQMVAYSKKARSESQAGDEEPRANAFTPINRTPSMSHNSLPSQSPPVLKTQVSKGTGQPRKRGGRRPKAQNPADLRLIAPAPFEVDTNNMAHSLPVQAARPSTLVNAPKDVRDTTPGAQAKADIKKHSYAFLNHKRGNSRNGVNSSPSSTASTGLPLPSNHLQFQPNPPPPAIQSRTVSMRAGEYESNQVQERQTGVMPLPSPADSESYLRPSIDHEDIYAQYPDNRTRPQDPPHQTSFAQDPQRRHSTQSQIIHQPSHTQLNHLNKPMPSQLMTTNNNISNKYLGTVPNNQIHGPSQIYSAPMTPNGQFPSPQEGTFGSFQITPQSSFKQASVYHGPSAQSSIPSTKPPDDGAIRHFIQQTNLHVFAPHNEGDFEIVRLGAYSGAATFIAKSLSTLGEVATKVTKLKISFTWMPEGSRARSLTMRLDGVEGKELAFKHICEKLTERYGVVGGSSPATLDVDVVLKEKDLGKKD